MIAVNLRPQGPCGGPFLWGGSVLITAKIRAGRVAPLVPGPGGWGWGVDFGVGLALLGPLD